ncbi:MAG: hypothetical protein A2Z72_03120 [Omnitrophica bacterium RBG_13_46_9]|nr:MAG: hypothetical protein A2Z72_03120 [Omnitrophica bacterium RBG_13_46_9]
MDKWYLDNLVCPRDHLRLEEAGGQLICANHHIYPVTDGIPVMLLDDVDQTLDVADASIKRAKGVCLDERAPNLHLESLGISEEEKKGLIDLSIHNRLNIDPVVSYICGATCGFSYKHLIGKLDFYPIPHLPMPPAKGSTLLDIGCNWGRWSIAGSQKGYTVVGIDPSLGAIIAARRVNEQLGLSVRYLVADGRWLPFNDNSFDNVFSYSVIQHLSLDNAGMVLSETARVLKPEGRSVIQMPNAFGIRSISHQIMRKFKEPTEFDVRYYTIRSLKKLFSAKIGKTKINAHCYFGLGLEASNLKFLLIKHKFIIILSELLRKLSRYAVPLIYFADSVYVESICEKTHCGSRRI